MPFVYSVDAAAELTTNVTPATVTETLFIKAGARDVALQDLSVIGKGAGLTSISGIAFRVKKWTTASTAGTGITPGVRDPGAQAAKHTAASRPTAGTGGGQTLQGFGCGAAGPGGWVFPNPQSMPLLEAAGAPSISVDDISGTASMKFEISTSTVE